MSTGISRRTESGRNRGESLSFSSRVKEELSRQLCTARHCQIAEIAAIISLCGRIQISEHDRFCIKIHTENAAVARKYFTLLQKTFNIDVSIAIRRNMTKRSCSYDICAQGQELLAVKNAVVQAVCCKRAYIRGAFIAAGSMSDPSKSYHFEIVCNTKGEADYLRNMISTFDLEAKVVERKRTYVVYLKEGSQIVDILNVMEAHVALLELENVRIMKEMRNSVNRKVNCETANINKTVSAAVRQMEDIKYIRDTVGFDRLPEGLRDVALTRLAYPEATLKELGELLESPVGKSGVNHRLRKLSEIAVKLRA